MFEDELIPLFEEMGTLYDLRLMMDPLTCHNKGYAFITYTNKEDASSAQKKVSPLCPVLTVVEREQFNDPYMG